jgi:hypothetical protein
MRGIVEDMSKRHDMKIGALCCCLPDVASSAFAENRPRLAAEHMKTSTSSTDARQKIFPPAGTNRFISLIPPPTPPKLLSPLVGIVNCEAKQGAVMKVVLYKVAD